METFAVILAAALLLSGGLLVCLTRRGRRLVGLYAGSGLLLLTGLAAELWFYLDCLACQRAECQRLPALCGRSQCCEWTGLAMLSVAILVVASAALLLLVAVLSRRWLPKKPADQERHRASAGSDVY